MINGAFAAPDLLEAIAMQCDSSSILLLLERVSRGCRNATSAAWRRITLERFPRAIAIAELSPQGQPAFRELFRRQLLAERVIQPRRLSLVEFVFTVELAGGYWI